LSVTETYELNMTITPYLSYLSVISQIAFNIRTYRTAKRACEFCFDIWKAQSTPQKLEKASVKIIAVEKFN